MENVINFGLGEPDFETPEPIRAAGVAAIGEGFTHYTANAGAPAVREAVAEKLRSRNRLSSVDAESIIITAGAMGALYLAMLALMEPGEEILASDPGWTNYEGQAILVGGRLIRVSAGADLDFALSRAELEAAAGQRAKIVLVNSPANPTGTVLRREQLEEIADFAAERDLYILSDEVYEDFVWDDAEHLSIGSLPRAADRTITIGSFSKSYAMTGWRAGYAAGPTEVISSMVKLQENIFSCASSISQMAAVAALQGGRGLLAPMLDTYRDRRALALELLSEIPGVYPHRPAGSFYIFADISALGESSEQFALELLEQEQVVVVPGDAFGPGGEGFVRISYATDQSNIREGMARLARFAANRSAP